MFQTNLSALALGTAPFGTGISRETAFTILDAYIGRGGNLIDTAAVYGMGLSEQTIGDWVSDRGIRYNITIATKGGHPSIPDWNRRITEKEHENGMGRLSPLCLCREVVIFILTIVTTIIYVFCIDFF